MNTLKSIVMVLDFLPFSKVYKQATMYFCPSCKRLKAACVQHLNLTMSSFLSWGYLTQMPEFTKKDLGAPCGQENFGLRHI